MSVFICDVPTANESRIAVVKSKDTYTGTLTHSLNDTNINKSSLLEKGDPSVVSVGGS